MQDRPSGAPPSGHWDGNVAVREPVQDVVREPPSAKAPGGSPHSLKRQGAGPRELRGGSRPVLAALPGSRTTF